MDSLSAALAIGLALAAVTSALVAAIIWRRRHPEARFADRALATSVRQRLMSVLDAVEEAVVFSDRRGVLRLLNQRAAELFDLDPHDYLGAPVVELLRAIARRMEEPEEFMEMFQLVRDDPATDIVADVDQIIPERRRLHLASRPARESGDEIVGRIDVYTDVTQQEKRAREVEVLYDEARRVAESYQRALLPSGPPHMTRLGMVGRYLPAGGDRAVCGDFYDFVLLGEDKVAVVVGDVCGVGPQAAADAAFCRYTLEAYTSELSEPGPLFEKLNQRVARGLPVDRFARMIYGVLDGQDARFSYVNAGHAPPLVRRAASGDIEWLEEAGLPLGVDDRARYTPGSVHLEPGDLLIFYTDGLTEAARSGRPFGRGRLADVVRDWGSGSPAELVQAMTRSLNTWKPSKSLRDDAVLLVCELVREPGARPAPRELLVPNEPARISEIRAFVGTFLADVRAPVDTASEVVLAVGEAAANCYRHGRRPDGGGEVRVRCVVDDASAVVTVADNGPGFDLAATDQLPRDPFASGGRGLFLMRALSDQVDIQSSHQGTQVTLVRSLENSARESRSRDT